MELNTLNRVGIAVWGIVDGFQNNLISNLIAKEVASTISDKRQLCYGALKYFFSIEKTANFSIATIFIPTVFDIHGRRAFVAISLCVESRYQFRNGIKEALSELAKIYEEYAAKGLQLLTEKHLLDAIEGTYTLESGAPERGIASSQTAVMAYSSEEQLSTILNDLNTGGYKQLYLHDGSNENLERRQDFKKIYQFESVHKVTISGYYVNRYKVKLNDQATENFPIYCFNGDRVSVTSLSNKETRSYTITHDQDLALNKLFPDYDSDDGSSDIKFPEWLQPVLKAAIVILFFGTILVINPLNFSFPPFSWFNSSKVDEIVQVPEKTPDSEISIEPASTFWKSNNWVGVNILDSTQTYESLPFTIKQNGKDTLHPQVPFSVNILNDTIKSYYIQVKLNNTTIWPGREYQENDTFKTSRVFPLNMNLNYDNLSGIFIEIIPNTETDNLLELNSLIVEISITNTPNRESIESQNHLQLPNCTQLRNKINAWEGQIKKYKMEVLSGLDRADQIDSLNKEIKKIQKLIDDDQCQE